MSKILTCEHLTKAYGKEKTALNGIDLNLDFGRIVGLLGPNGSGKTTLLKLANGLLQPTEGVVKIAGMIPGPETKEIVSYLPDADWLPDWMRVEELVNMFRDFYGTPCEAKAYIGFDAAKANEMLARLNIDPKARLKTLSKGTKEKVQLVLAMSRAAKLYLLDEPIGGVDPAARDYLARLADLILCVYAACMIAHPFRKYGMVSGILAFIGLNVVENQIDKLLGTNHVNLFVDITYRVADVNVTGVTYGMTPMQTMTTAFGAGSGYLFCFVVTSAFAAAYFCLTRWLMKHKLNLE